MHFFSAPRPLLGVNLPVPSNLPLQTYFDSQREHKAAWMKFLDRDGPAMAVTLSWNMPRPVYACRADLRTFLAFAERRVLGSRFHRYPPEERLDAVFVFEGLGSTNVHAHSIWWPSRDRWFRFLKLFPRKRSGAWDSVVRKGSYDVKLLNANGSNDEFTGYILKHQGKNSEADAMVWASEFHPSR